MARTTTTNKNMARTTTNNKNIARTHGDAISQKTTNKKKCIEFRLNTRYIAIL